MGHFGPAVGSPRNLKHFNISGAVVPTKPRRLLAMRARSAIPSVRATRGLRSAAKSGLGIPR